VRTKLSKEIDTTSYAAMYDRCCKNLLTHRIILAHIMKDAVSEFKDFDVNYIADNCIEGKPQVSEVSVHRDGKPEKIVGDSNEDATVDEGVVYFDIRFVAVIPQTGESIRLIINLEAQNKYNPGYSLVRRGLYYCCRLISAQYGTEFVNSNYDDIKKVYSIWICTNVPDFAKNTITRYAISEQSIVGDMTTDAQSYDIMNVVMVCLDKDKADVDTDAKGVLKLLRVLLSGKVSTENKKNVLNDDFDIKMQVDIGEELNSMCNLSAGVREEARLEGIERGIEQGIEITRIESIKKLMKNMSLTFEKAADALGLSADERKKYADKV
jgi:predicted transposase/invertase (TIGR01784 family)